MKLRNKKTREIRELPDGFFCGDNLKKICEEWEDYEEPKEHWYIDCDGEVYSADRLNGFDLDRMLNIGNCFNTREEAEKAVEELKAWKRLKDKGLSFERWTIGCEYGNTITFSDYIEYNDETRVDLNLLFGGEE